MGTNYYAESSTGPTCPTCGRHDVAERVHIGKSLAGWCFSLHVIPDLGLNSLDDWRAHLSKPGVAIEDEYGCDVTLDEMFSIITERRRDMPTSWGPERFAQNFAEPGPNNLVRHTIGGHCIGHGDGTWDLISGDFS